MVIQVPSSRLLAAALLLATLLSCTLYSTDEARETLQTHGRTVVHSVKAAFRPSAAKSYAQHVASSYYAQEGLLQLDSGGGGGNSSTPAHRRARWIPYEMWDAFEAQGKTGLEPDVRLGDGFDILEDWQAALGDEAVALEAQLDGRFEFIRDKTILFLGDSVDRGASDIICNLLGGKRSIRQFMTGNDLRLKSNNWRGDAHHCQLPHFAGNATLWSFMIYGSVSDEETFDRRLGKLSPKTLVPRYDLIALRLEEASVVPDMVLMHTQMWDLAVSNVERSKQNVPDSETLDLPFLKRVKDQLSVTLTVADELFPRAKKLFRILHHSRPDHGFWWGQDVYEDTEQIERTPNGNNKIESLNAIVRKTIPQFGVFPFDLRHLLQGYRADFRDAVHPGDTGRLLYTQLLLYWMKKLQ